MVKCHSKPLSLKLYKAHNSLTFESSMAWFNSRREYDLTARYDPLLKCFKLQATVEHFNYGLLPKNILFALSTNIG
jgi:hypothetical protein